MAGSLTYREYESDHGVKYAIKVDKSNADMVIFDGVTKLCKPRTSELKIPPKSLILRRVYCFSQLNVNHKRSFIIGNRDVIANPQMEIGGVYIVDNSFLWSWIITGYKGESFTTPQYIFQTDTGLNDGTTSNS